MNDFYIIKYVLSDIWPGSTLPLPVEERVIG